MKTRIVPIGNSQGVRIPKPLIAAAGLNEEVELKVLESGLLIANVNPVRVGWEAAAKRMRAANADRLLDDPPETSEFDLAAWSWD